MKTMNKKNFEDKWRTIQLLSQVDDTTSQKSGRYKNVFFPGNKKKQELTLVSANR